MSETQSDTNINKPGLPSYYIGIGASAGGLEAIESFFKAMPIDSGMAFVVIQHLSPDHKSLMPELLSKRTNMPVYRAEDGLEVQPDSIYLLVPRKSLKIFHGKLVLSDMDHSAGRINLPIDIFFKSLAEDQGEKAIAIILSGTGSDGTRGCRAIKEFGGMIMVQDENSARFDGMPKSLMATGLPDFILPPYEMPKQLEAFVKHPFAAKENLLSPLEQDEGGITRIFALLREKTRIDFTYYKPNTIIRRLERRMSVNQVHDMADYIRYIEAHPHEIELLNKEFLIGVTNFYRDQAAFHLLEEKYIPEIVQNEGAKELRIWVAGCSTGEEAYTLAILFREVMERLGRHFDVKIFATDVDQSSIELASTGIYPVGIASDIPTNLLNKYFISREDSFQIVRSIREMVVFAQHNLVKDPPFTNINLVSCRNLLIYLQPILQKKVLEYFNFSLVPQGILFLGMSETTGDMSDYFESLDHKHKIYSSKGKRKPANMSLDEQLSQGVFYKSRLAGSQRFSRQYEEQRVLDRFLQTFAGDYILLAMVVNSSGELIHTVGDTDSFLRLSPGEMTTDIIKLVCKELYIPISTGIQKVINKNKELSFSNIRIPGEKDSVNIKLKLKPIIGKKGQESLVGIFIEEMKAHVDHEVLDTQTFDVSKEAEQRINDLEQELQFTRENLQATVEELETSNEELQATNEELLSSNEELQSTNEELQSVNEELFTVNAELQSKITELTELTNDLDNLLDSTEIASLFLDENLHIRRYSPMLNTLFNIIKSDIGRSVFHISHQIKDIDLEAYIKSAQDTRKIQEYVVSVNERHYLMRILPYKISSNNYSGVVVLFINITTLTETKQALKEQKKILDLTMEAAKIGNWVWNIETNNIVWSENVELMFGFKNGDFKGTYEAFMETVHPEDIEKVQKAVQEALENSQDYLVEHRIIWPDGTVRWVVEVGGIEKNGHNKPVRMLGIVRDITSKRQNSLGSVSS
ncbi:MAG: PAS domain-containing protein [Spirochaetota bacterium]|nr:PAS domain-containing protein [Spirochaetota bacterium]